MADYYDRDERHNNLHQSMINGVDERYDTDDDILWQRVMENCIARMIDGG